ncbi:MAG: redox-regulated ATPase YchF [Candidatus Dormibacteria bacterium]
MGLSVAIAGLPNAGKSTLFNALTRAGAAVGNYPFTTIEPNTGIVPVPDPRLDGLARMFRPPRVIATTVTFTDIAGLVRGASRGEGLGNKFLGHIRDCDAIAQVVRSFADPDVSHVEGGVDPVHDMGVVELELQLADLDTVSRRLERLQKAARVQKQKELGAMATLERVGAHLDSGRPVRVMSLSPEEHTALQDLCLLTAKPLLVVVNVDESSAREQAIPLEVVEAARRSGGQAVAISARIESELAELEPDDQPAFLADMGLSEPGLDRLARSAHELLNLLTFFTAGDSEVRAWTVRRGDTAIAAAGTIHTDFARGFIRAEVVAADTLLGAGSYAAVRDQGKLRLEGRDYVVRDGDVMHFRFNV